MQKGDSIGIFYIMSCQMAANGQVLPMVWHSVFRQLNKSNEDE
jgi:hypothetical protein